MADTSWVVDDEDGDLYAEAEANGASVFTLSSKKRSQTFVNVKRASFGKFHRMQCRPPACAHRLVTMLLFPNHFYFTS